MGWVQHVNPNRRLAVENKTEYGSSLERWIKFKPVDPRYQDILNDLDRSIVSFGEACFREEDEQLKERFGKAGASAVAERCMAALEFYLIESNLTLPARRRFDREERVKLAAALCPPRKRKKAPGA